MPRLDLRDLCRREDAPDAGGMGGLGVAFDGWDAAPEGGGVRPGGALSPRYLPSSALQQWGVEQTTS